MHSQRGGEQVRPRRSRIHRWVHAHRRIRKFLTDACYASRTQSFDDIFLFIQLFPYEFGPPTRRDLGCRLGSPGSDGVRTMRRHGDFLQRTVHRSYERVITPLKSDLPILFGSHSSSEQRTQPLHPPNLLSVLRDLPDTYLYPSPCSMHGPMSHIRSFHSLLIKNAVRP